MTGEDLYGKWTAALREQRAPTRPGAYTSVFGELTPAPPTAWAFLRADERAAWDALAGLASPPTRHPLDLLVDDELRTQFERTMSRQRRPRLVVGPPAFRSKAIDGTTCGVRRPRVHVHVAVRADSDDRLVNQCAVCGGGRDHLPGCTRGAFEADARTDSIR